MELHEKILLSVKSAAILGVLKLLYSSLKLTEEGLENLEEARVLSDSGKIIYSTWHSNLSLLAYHLRGKKIKLLVSNHRDGQLMVFVVEKLGFTTARGSSTRNGVAGLLGMLRGTTETDLGITPDGPRGPARQIKEGVAALARIKRIPVVPISFVPNRFWRLSSWDRHIIPKPGSECFVRYGKPVLNRGDNSIFMAELKKRMDDISLKD